MAKIRLVDNNVIVLYNEQGNGLYDIVKNFKIDLTNRKHYQIKSDIEKEIEWEFTKDDEVLMIERLKKDTWFVIENCNEVLISYRKNNDEKNTKKHEKILEKNKIILDFLKNF
jgi:hypothetical protein